MIKKNDNVLNDDLIKNIIEYFKSILVRDVWDSSSGWDQNLSLISTNILTHQIVDKILKKEIKANIETALNINFHEKN